MLVSHKHKFIYIKTAKTASTSTEISLSRYCNGPGDIVTPVDAEGEAIRREMGVHPRNYLADWRRVLCVYDYWRLLTRGRRKRRFSGHFTSREIQSLLPARRLGHVLQIHIRQESVGQDGLELLLALLTRPQADEHGRVPHTVSR